jgi:methylamine---glutamate N-methyltransferase subunit A
MCGIVGLHLKNPGLQPRLGELLSQMLEAMTTRGPDSAGIAVYADRDQAPAGHEAGPGPGQPGQELRYSLRSDAAIDWDLLAKRITAETGRDLRVEPLGSDSAIFVSPPAETPAAETPPAETAFLAAVRRVAPQVSVPGFGRSMVVVKDVGAPAAICARYGIPGWSGYQGIGHTRMATESAVTTAHSHPFAPAADLALVHNGSFSNYATIRGRLARQGIRCDTDNDSEVAARLVASRMAEGADLEEGLRTVLKEMDGFFTLLVTTRTQFAVVRDSFACKPAVIAETPDYVAMASEYHALAGLPGITGARVFEPMPEEIHVWSR